VTGTAIRPARADEGERLRAVMRVAKAHWGYDPAVVETWVAGEDFSAARFERHEIVVAERDGAVVGWAALGPVEGGASVLEDMWVVPEAMGAGLGRRLFEHAAARARTQGARELRWEADPNAVGFYERMGAAVVGETQTTWERSIPLMQLELAS
jgi:GNAT superfamily N-acetyltransferase